jgi:hypothetical protein
VGTLEAADVGFDVAGVVLVVFDELDRAMSRKMATTAMTTMMTAIKAMFIPVSSSGGTTGGGILMITTHPMASYPCAQAQ